MKPFMAPIPGMSLTREKGNATWEQPPLYARPEEALAFYMEKLSDEETLEDMLFALEQGLPLSTFVDSMTSYGVMEGYHTIDVKVLLSPVLHEHILSLAQALDIDVVEEDGPSKEDRRAEKEKQRLMVLLSEEFDEPIAPEQLQEVDEASEMLSGEGEDNFEDTPEEPEAPIIPRRA